MLGQAGLAERSRIIMEKPFGTDLASAKALNASLHETFAEEQIFRIDHFLGKEAALNILAFRFANGLFEPIWNRDHIDHVQIDVPETLDLGTRAGFYEKTGAYRDMVVTHLFQVLAFMAMEPPTALEPRRDRRGEEQGLPLAAPDRARPRRAGPVPRLPRRAGRVAATRRPRRSSPCGARSTTGAGRACRSTCGPASAWPRAPHHLDRLPRAAAEHVPARLRRRRARPRPPDVRPRRRVQALAVVLRQAARAGDEARQAQPAVRAARDRPAGRRARGLRAADPRRHERRPHAVHNAEGIERLWDLSTPLLEAPPPVRPYAPGSWGPNAIHQLIAPHAWRLPFERAWRTVRASGSLSTSKRA